MTRTDIKYVGVKNTWANAQTEDKQDYIDSKWMRLENITELILELLEREEKEGE
jgi:hypothetical protein